MKLKLICLFEILFSLSVFGQSIDLNLDVTLNERMEGIIKGSSIKLKELRHLVVTENGYSSDVFYLYDESGNRFKVNKGMEDAFSFKCNSVQDIWDGGVITNVLSNISKKGYQYELRNEMESEALGVIAKIKEYNAELSDDYLESYIYSLCSKIAPEKFIDGRVTNINVLIKRSLDVNAGTYPNGTIVITTGLLSQLHSEDELVAILAHEIAHYVLDHSIININKATTRQKRAEFWSALLTGATAVAEGVAATKNNYYTPGAATIGVAALTTAISAQVIERMGMKFNHEQEYVADMFAIMILKQLGYSPNALSTALSHIKERYDEEHNSTIYLSSYTHPELKKRIKYCGTPEKVVDHNFEKMLSFAITDVATLRYSNKRYSQCIPLLTQNINNNVGTSDDYILMASCLLRLKDTPESNAKVLKLIETAKTLNTGSMINMYSAEIIANLRLKKIDNANSLLAEYIEKLNLLEKEQSEVRSGRAWEYNQAFVVDERNWAKRMLVKLNGMR